MKCSVYIAASLDGYIAREDGDISWLEKPEYTAAKIPGLGFNKFIRTVDSIVMGRNTFDKVLTFGPWPYKKIPVTVLTTRELNISRPLRNKISTGNGPPEEIVSGLERKGFRHLYIDGGITIQKFLDAGLIDEIIITAIPILLGNGIPLFGKMQKEIGLHLAGVESSENGIVQMRYSLENK